jgi:gas vesicle protein
MMGRKQPEVVYVERGGDASAKWLFWGACLGAGLALLYAPRTGEETRRNLQRRLWKLRAMSEEKLDDLMQTVGGKARDLAGSARELMEEDEDFDEEDLEGVTGEPAPVATPSAREELELRLEKARSRRRRTSADYEEPLA